MQTISVLGSTGSIGTQTLAIARLFPDRIRVAALTAGSNWELLAEQAKEFRPRIVCIQNSDTIGALRSALHGLNIEVVCGVDGLHEVAILHDVDTVVAAIMGAGGLQPVLHAAESGKRIALANKETLVVAGELVTATCEANGSELIPVDSEHSAIFQCLVGEPAETVESITLTASGGPFLDRSADTFDSISPDEALNHPNWSMGAKITIDSATLMNKGLEVIEAHWLFQQDVSEIDVVIHPQSIVHSVVNFRDGSSKAQLGIPDMKVPIQYALTYPDRWPAPHARIAWQTLGELTFMQPDYDKFPCLNLAFDAVRTGGLAPCVLNAANEVAVAGFLEGRIRFTDIARLVSFALNRIPASAVVVLGDLLEIDSRARKVVAQELNRISS